MGSGVTPGHKVVAEQRHLDRAIVLAFAPLTKVAVAELVLEHGDDAILRPAFGTGLFRHKLLFRDRSYCCQGWLAKQSR